MLWTQLLLYGMIASIISIALPGMLNMTVASISIERGIKAAFRFSIGASLVQMFYAAIALFFADVLGKNPDLFQQLKIFVLILLIVLAIFFYFKGKRARVRARNKRKKHSFWAGVFLAMMNLMIIPFFFAVGAYLKSRGYIDQQRSAILVFVLGTGIGAFLSFAVYARFAQVIAERTDFFARNINYFISGLFFLLAILQLVSLLQWY